MIPVSWYLYLGTGLFTIGVIGVLTRRNVIIILMSIELILNAVNINLVAFSQMNSLVPERGTGLVKAWTQWAVNCALSAPPHLV